LNANFGQTKLTRKRFTLFHEAFHIEAHDKADPVFRTRGCERGTFNELLAECFSSINQEPCSKRVPAKVSMKPLHS